MFFITFIAFTVGLIQLTKLFNFLTCKRKFGRIGKSLRLESAKIGDISLVLIIFLSGLIEIILILGQLQRTVTFHQFMEFKFSDFQVEFRGLDFQFPLVFFPF